ncbi:iron-containing alcohol dehydrogenase [Chloroflexota bacterium]
MDKVSVFNCKTEIYHGFGAASLTGEQASRFGITRALLVTDQGVLKSGLIQDIEDSLQSANISYEIFDDVEENPDIKTMHKGAVRLKEAGGDGVVIVGGGSPLCAGRGIALKATNNGKISDYEGVNKYKSPPLPAICLPTTAGSGSDVSPAFMFHDASQRAGGGVVTGNNLAPPVSILDPLLLQTCPRGQMIISGLDALSHAVEALMTERGTLLTDAIACESIRLIMGNLKEAALTKNLKAKSIQHLASSMANIACGNTGLAIGHGMASVHEVKLPHGYKVGVLLPYAMEFNLPACEHKLAQMAITLGEPTCGVSISDLAKSALKLLKKLYIDLDLPRKFEPAEFPVDKIPELSKGVMGKLKLVENNVRQFTESDVMHLYEASLKGWQLD